MTLVVLGVSRVVLRCRVEEVALRSGFAGTLSTWQCVPARRVATERADSTGLDFWQIRFR